MKELIRTNDFVRLSWIEALLAAAGIEFIVLDQHASVIEGSVGAIQRRIMVDDDDHRRAARLLLEAEA
jgi:Putative prokaryotic signal transducing protein